MPRAMRCFLQNQARIIIQNFTIKVESTDCLVYLYNKYRFRFMTFKGREIHVRAELARYILVCNGKTKPKPMEYRTLVAVYFSSCLCRSALA
jgi:hypothetical protein